MKRLSLASRYRPQKFADVAGQPLAATALSRASELDRVAPAYLLSGTRGVGKTTIARIFAKALNCQNGPSAEPCNECTQCRHITAGNHIDVNEIDGASNTGVDDVRSLRDNIGFMPMEGRYKIFIIDEAHMLSKNAFNALLKTLEEPPSHTVFIFATTEAHRFPATIISRCQHFVFRHLSEQVIFEHLVKILKLENLEFEDAAVRLIARRAAGSVRDSLSMLDQALAICGGKLEAQTAREALGVAGPELYGRLFEAIAGRECGDIINLAGGLLASGVDMGFFTRELVAMLRNMFLFRQTGGKIIESLKNITDDERVFLQKHAPAFSAPHLHAAWQMALEGQRGISQSPEPGAALELLLLNLALIPQLLPVGSVSRPNIAPLKGERHEPAESQANEGPRPAESQDASKFHVEEKSEREYGSSQAETNHPEDWGEFYKFCRVANEAGKGVIPNDILTGLTGDWKDGVLKISTPSVQQWERLNKHRSALDEALRSYCGSLPKVELPKPAYAQTTRDLMTKLEQTPELQLCQKILGARITDCREKQVQE